MATMMPDLGISAQHRGKLWQESTHSLGLAGLGLLGLLSTRRGRDCSRSSRPRPDGRGAAARIERVPGQDRRTKNRFTISTGWTITRRTKGSDLWQTLPDPIGRQSLAEWLAQQP
jgi:hypothetical protein